MLSGQDAIVVACLDQLFAKLRDFEYTDSYMTPDQVRAHVEGGPARES